MQWIVNVQLMEAITMYLNKFNVASNCFSTGFINDGGKIICEIKVIKHSKQVDELLSKTHRIANQEITFKISQ